MAVTTGAVSWTLVWSVTVSVLYISNNSLLRALVTSMGCDSVLTTVTHTHYLESYKVRTQKYSNIKSLRWLLLLFSKEKVKGTCYALSPFSFHSNLWDSLKQSTKFRIHSGLQRRNFVTSLSNISFVQYFEYTFIKQIKYINNNNNNNNDKNDDVDDKEEDSHNYRVTLRDRLTMKSHEIIWAAAYCQYWKNKPANAVNKKRGQTV